MKLHLACLLALLGLASPAHAELWGYVDGDRVAHFSGSRLDSRFQAVISDTADPLKVPGKTDGGGPLLTWLDFAPEVLAVQPYVQEAARSNGVDAELLEAVIAVESGYRRDAVSPRGAAGLMQISTVAAQRYATPREAQRPALDLLLDPRSNVQIGARMLADLIRRFGHVDAALAAWNAGEGAVRRAGGKMPPIDETQAHVHMVLELYWALLQRSLPALAQQMKIEPAEHRVRAAERLAKSATP